MKPNVRKYFEAIDGTWPAAQFHERGPWRLRLGMGGGKRVCATTAIDKFDSSQIEDAQQAMIEMGQEPLFMITQNDEELDHALSRRGYEIIDPVIVYSCDLNCLATADIPKLSSFCIWEPLEIMKEIWAKGGIGPQRLAVMERAAHKTSILGRTNNRPAGVCFAAIHQQICMVHAVEVLPQHRQQGVARRLMHQAARWAQSQGAQEIAVLTTCENSAANGLYQSLGFNEKCRYHYRQQPKDQK